MSSGAALVPAPACGPAIARVLVVVAMVGRTTRGLIDPVGVLVLGVGQRQPTVVVATEARAPEPARVGQAA